MVIDSSDAGVTLHGPENAGHEALFDRDNTASGNNVLELYNAENVVIENLAFTGGYYGIYVSGSETSNGPVITGCNINDNASYGIYVDNSPAKITSNTVSGNDIGIYANGYNLQFPIRVSNNEVFGNDREGIYASYNVLVNGNTVYRHQGSDHYGIHVTYDASAMYNEVYDNEYGIYAGDKYYSRSATVVGNNVYGNTTGIMTSYKSIISQNKIYSNTIGIDSQNQVDNTGTISNNVIYANSDYGIVINRSRDGLKIVNNTIVQSEGNALKLQTSSSNVALLNNIFDVNEGYCLEINSNSFTGFSSDYNIMHGNTAIWGETKIDDLADWYYELGFDRHSYNSDPLFTENYHVSADSVAVDHGAPTDSPVLEMYPNGSRVNIGAYGNTFEATLSPSQGIEILSPIALDKYENGSEILITWSGYGLGSIASELTVSLEYSLDGGENWDVLASGLAVNTDGSGSYSWLADIVGEEIIVRISSEYPGIDISDISSIFQVSAGGNSYYINTAGDTDFSDNEYTFAAGDNRNSGKSPYYPMASLSALLDIYDLGAGDIVYIDSGIYHVLNNMVIDSSDAGVTLHGPENAGHEALFDRDNTASGNNVLELYNAENVVIENLAFTGGYYGIYVSGSETSNGPVITGCNINDNASYGIYVDNSPAKITSNTVSGNDIGIYANGDNLQFPIRVSNNEVFGNDREGIYASYNVLVNGNTVYGHQGSDHYGIQVTYDASAMYNEVYDNEYGIYAGDKYYSRSATVVGNNVYGNTTGIMTSYKSIISQNKIYSNTIGIDSQNQVDNTGTISNNIIYANSDYGIVINRGRDGIKIVNNTIYQPVGDAIRIQSGSSNISMINNIFTIDTGHCLSFATDSTNGLISNNNLFYRSVLINSYIARIGLADVTDLGQWQQYLSQDTSSIESDPLFIDIDGADGILGYQPSEIHVNNGADDNFVLAKNSPAIDAGYSWMAASGDTTHDDPGVANTGSADYYPVVSQKEDFAETGTAMNWQSSDRVYPYSLPFNFELYGVSYSTIYISTSGNIQFGSNSSLYSSLSDINNLIDYAMIAPLWCNIDTNRSNDNIYIDSSQPDIITIRWDASSKTDGSGIDFAVSLHSNGEIVFAYDILDSSIDAVIGISSGKGEYQLVNINDVSGQNSAVNFSLLPGVKDIGAYEFSGSSLDNTAPEITGTTPEFIHNSGQDNTVIDQINIFFSEPLNEIDAQSESNYILTYFGSNGIEGDADDYIIELSTVYTTGSTIVTLDVISGKLEYGRYKLMISGDSMHDVSGLALQQDYIRVFDITHDQQQAELSAAPAVVETTTTEDTEKATSDVNTNSKISSTITKVTPNNITTIASTAKIEPLADEDKPNSLPVISDVPNPEVHADRVKFSNINIDELWSDSHNIHNIHTIRSSRFNDNKRIMFLNNGDNFTDIMFSNFVQSNINIIDIYQILAKSNE